MSVSCLFSKWSAWQWQVLAPLVSTRLESFSLLYDNVHFQDNQDMFERFKSEVQESLRAQEARAAKLEELISTLKNTIEEQAATILEMNRTIEIVAKHPILSDFIQRSMAKATKGKSIFINHYHYKFNQIASMINSHRSCIGSCLQTEGHTSHAHWRRRKGERQVPSLHGDLPQHS